MAPQPISSPFSPKDLNSETSTNTPPPKCPLLNLPPELFHLISSKVLYNGERPEYSFHPDQAFAGLEVHEHLKVPRNENFASFLSLASTCTTLRTLCLEGNGPQCLRFRSTSGSAEEDEGILARMAGLRMFCGASFLDISVEHSEIGQISTIVSNMGAKLKGVRYSGQAHPLDIVALLRAKLDYLEITFSSSSMPRTLQDQSVREIHTLVLADEAWLRPARHGKRVSMASRHNWRDAEMVDMLRTLRLCSGVSLLVLRLDDQRNWRGNFLEPLGRHVDEGGLEQMEHMILVMDSTELCHATEVPELPVWLERNRRVDKLPLLRNIQFIYQYHPVDLNELKDPIPIRDPIKEPTRMAMIEGGATQAVMQLLQARFIPSNLDRLKDEVNHYVPGIRGALRELDVQFRLPPSPAQVDQPRGNPHFLRLRTAFKDQAPPLYVEETETDGWQRARRSAVEEFSRVVREKADQRYAEIVAAWEEFKFRNPNHPPNEMM